MRATPLALGSVSSADPTGGNNDRIAKIAPGEKRVIFDVKGPGAITHIWVTIAPPPPELSRHDVIPSRAARQPMPEIREWDIHIWRDAWRKARGGGSQLWGNEHKK